MTRATLALVFLLFLKTKKELRTTTRHDNNAGRHGATILLGTSQWSTAPLTEKQQKQTQERFFDDEDFMDSKTAVASAKKASKDDGERPAPYSKMTLARNTRTKRTYQKSMENFLGTQQSCAVACVDCISKQKLFHTMCKLTMSNTWTSVGDIEDCLIDNQFD